MRNNDILITGAAYPLDKDEHDLGLKYSGKGTAYLRFKVATYGGKEKPKVYWKVTLFGELAEFTAESCAIGDSLIIAGRVEDDSYEKKDGTGKVYQQSIIGDEVGLNLRWQAAAKREQVKRSTPQEGNTSPGYGTPAAEAPLIPPYRPSDDEAPF